MATAMATKPRVIAQEKRLTHSALQTARSCPRKYQLAYEVGLRRTVAEKALFFGSAFHEGLDTRAAALIMGKDYDEATQDGINRALAYFDASAPLTTDERYSDYLTTRTILYTMFRGYCWRWKEFDSQLQYVKTEMKFDVPIVNPESGRARRLHTFAGKLDKIVRLADQRLAVMEHKTAGQDIAPESDYMTRLRIDSQISGYIAAANHLGFEIDTVLYDVIRKPAIRPATLTQGETAELIETGVYNAKPGGEGERVEIARYDGVTVVRNEANEPVKVIILGEEAEVIPGKKGFSIRETPALFAARLWADITTNHEYYYQRREIPRGEADMEEFSQELLEESKRISFYQERGIYPRNTGACLGFGRCPFFGLCTNGYDVNSEIMPDGFEIVANVHQELED